MQEAAIGLFSFIGGLFGAGAQKKASRGAEAALIASLDKGIAQQQSQYDQNRADFMPYLQAGTDALGGIRGLTGLNGNDALQSAITGLQNSPLYGSYVRNGEEALLQNAAATGGLRGGNLQRGLADFRYDALAQTIQQQLGNLGNVAGMGLGATGQNAGLGTQISGNITNLLGQQGQARADGLLTRGGITAGMWNNAGNFLDSAVMSALGAGAGPGGAGFNFGQFAGKMF